MNSSNNTKPKPKTKTAKKPEQKLRDLATKKDVRGGGSLNYGGIKNDYNP